MKLGISSNIEHFSTLTSTLLRSEFGVSSPTRSPGLSTKQILLKKIAVSAVRRDEGRGYWFSNIILYQDTGILLTCLDSILKKH